MTLRPARFKWMLGGFLILLTVIAGLFFLENREPIMPETQAQGTGSPPPSLPSPSNIEMVIATDLHYLSPSLQDGGTAFQDYIDSGDSKLLHYSEELLDAWSSQVIKEQPDAVILSGDLTNNGEEASHLELAEKLQSIEQAGIKVLVIPGNHDLLNPWARSFMGDRQLKTDTISPEQFRDIYQSYGYAEALDEDTDSLSYIAEVTGNLRIMMLDTSSYQDNLELGYPKTNGGVSSTTLKWIRQQAAAASDAGAELIAVMHHNLLDHSDFSMGFTLDNADKVFPVLQESGISLTLSGHIHIQDISSYEGMTDIATSSLAVYPYQYGKLVSNPAAGFYAYETHPVDVEAWSKEHKRKNKELLRFTSYGEQFFREQSYRKAAEGLAKLGYSKRQVQAMSEVMAELNVRYFAGTVHEMDEIWLKHEGMKLWQEADAGFLSRYILSMAASGKENNRIQIKSR